MRAVRVEMSRFSVGMRTRTLTRRKAASWVEDDDVAGSIEVITLEHAGLDRSTPRVRYEASAVLFSSTAASIEVHGWMAIVRLPNCWLLMALLTVPGLGLVGKPAADLLEPR